MAKAAGFDIGFRLIFAGGQLLTYMLLPSDARSINPWWFSNEARRFVKQRRKRGDRQIEKYIAQISPDGWHPSRNWDQRSELAATLIPKGLAIMDVGCGGMYFEKHARPRHYLPVDMAPRDHRTQVHDLDAAPLPAEWIDAVDLVCFLGVLEYVQDPAAHLRRIAARARPILCSYNVAERRRHDSLRYAKWTNTLDTDAFESVLAESGFVIARRLPFGNRQLVYLAFPEPVANPPPWWRDLPHPPLVAENGAETLRVDGDRAPGTNA
ncbi:methyltransferase domain-containing protein [Oleomonas cavernae]|uniref:Methyltransferase domain-containing protein n=1 Tax=Oleomonas cavernae TaxID=2320859 RepID=A0A418WT94_9PROT|nr:methyltransferase domain-containing protein [Oleomonas cavernae]RJF94493.1 methyltransferase domain-containing protein [Oleomonas cavernae]